MLKIASRHRERNLFQAILATTYLMCDGIEDATELLRVLAPLAQQLERLDDLDNFLEGKAVSISDINVKLSLTPEYLKERDALLDSLVTEAVELTRAPAAIDEGHEIRHPFKDKDRRAR